MPRGLSQTKAGAAGCTYLRRLQRPSRALANCTAMPVPGHATHAQPVPRGASVEHDARLARRAGRVREAAVVRHEYVRVQARRECSTQMLIAHVPVIPYGNSIVRCAHSAARIRSDRRATRAGTTTETTNSNAYPLRREITSDVAAILTLSLPAHALPLGPVHHLPPVRNSDGRPAVHTKPTSRPAVLDVIEM
jgi:hypothetical protein